MLHKVCEICGGDFHIPVSAKNQKQRTCSVSCGNKMRHLNGYKHPFYLGKKNTRVRVRKSTKEVIGYRVLCFQHHPKKCAVCPEHLIVEVHHIDGNHSNNDINNLVPLCPNHHFYMHNGYEHLIQEQLDAYLLAFRNK